MCDLAVGLRRGAVRALGWLLHGASCQHSAAHHIRDEAQRRDERVHEADVHHANGGAGGIGEQPECALAAQEQDEGRSAGARATDDGVRDDAEAARS